MNTSSAYGETHHEYVAHDCFDTSYKHSYRAEREYERYPHNRDRYDDDRSYRDKRGQREIRDKYAVRYDKDRSKHHHYPTKRDRSREHSRERIIVGRRDRDKGRSREYDRSRERDRDRRDRERDYRERDRERSSERDRCDKLRGSDNYNTARYARDYSESSTSASAQPSHYPSSNNTVYFPVQTNSLPASTHLMVPAIHGPYDYHTYGYSADSQTSAHIWHGGGGRTWPPLQQQLQHPTQPPLPPPPPDDNPDWDEPEPPPPGGYSSNDELLQSDQKQRKISTVAELKSLNATEVKSDDTADLGTVDLDTRIALMFKGKSFGNAPPFLQMDSSDSETEKGSVVTGTRNEADEEEGEVNSDSNGKVSLKCSSNKNITDDKSLNIKLGVNQHGASDISSSDDEILLKKESYSPILPKPKKKEVDGMSVSSLSSNEDGKQVNEKDNLSSAMVTSEMSVTGATASYIYPTNASTNPYYYPGNGYPSYPPGDVATSAQYFPNPAYIQSSYLPGIGGSLSAFGASAGGTYSDAYRDAYKFYGSDGYTTYISNHSDIYEEDPYKRHIEEVVKKVSDELKQILKRDFNKKMIENTAFKNFETWWDEQMQKSRRHKNEAEKITEKPSLINSLPNSSVPTKARIDKPPDINQLINSHRDITDFSSNYPALGLRASIPKLPSFRRIRKQTSPKSQKTDDEKHLSDQEEMVQGSDSEKEDSNLSASTMQQIVSRVKDTKIRSESATKMKPNTPHAKRKGSSSSFFSSSSSSEAENEDDDDEADGSSGDGDDSASDDDLSSISDVNVKVSEKENREKKQRQTYDKNSYIGKEIETKSIATKSGIYSDTEDEEKSSKSNIYSAEKSLKDNTKALVSDLEDISKDSSFSVGDDTLATKIESGNTKLMSEQSECVGHTELAKEDNSMKEQNLEQKKSVFEYDRIYSDSEEEREYQEKRRRNTEYMAQIEREFIEEQNRKIKEAQEEQNKDAPCSEQSLDANYGGVLPKTTSQKSIEMPVTPDITKIPPTPGAKLSIDQDFNSATPTAKKDKINVRNKKNRNISANKNEQSKSKKDLKIINDVQCNDLSKDKNSERCVSLTTSKDTSKFVNSAPNDFNGYYNEVNLKALEESAPSTITPVDQNVHIHEPMKTTIDLSQTEEENEEVKLSPTSSDGGSSQASQASQVALEHCYSLPPQADISKPKTSPTSDTDRKKQHYLAHDHGGYTTPPGPATPFSDELPSPQILQQSFAVVKPGPGRPRKDAGRIRKNDESVNQRTRIKSEQSLDQIVGVLAHNNFNKALAVFEPRDMFKPRETTEEMMVLYEFLTRGIDAEDIQYIRRCYEIHLQEDTYG